MTSINDESTSLAVSSPHASEDRHARRARRQRTFRRTLAAVLGMFLVAGGAYSVTLWLVGLNAGSSGEGQSATVQNLTIAAVAVPAATNRLYPGGLGDVVLTISNPNPYPVTLTGVNLPVNTLYAVGYSDSTLLTPVGGCALATSDVSWDWATGVTNTAHLLNAALTIGAFGNANNPLTVTLTNDASMAITAPAACENTFFSMPSLTGIAATGGAAGVTTSPVVDFWNS